MDYITDRKINSIHTDIITLSYYTIVLYTTYITYYSLIKSEELDPMCNFK